ncbi:MAG: hypothetical protein WCX65_07535, partial [bacterium]
MVQCRSAGIFTVGDLRNLVGNTLAQFVADVQNNVGLLGGTEITSAGFTQAHGAVNCSIWLGTTL